MIVTKIFDAVVLINIIQDLDFEEILIDWGKNPRYKQWTSYEVNLEVQKNARLKLNKLIALDIIKIFKPVPSNDIKQIQNLNPKLSIADC